MRQRQRPELTFSCEHIMTGERPVTLCYLFTNIIRYYFSLNEMINVEMLVTDVLSDHNANTVYSVRSDAEGSCCIGP